MKIPLSSLALAACLFASCDKTSNPADSGGKPKADNQNNAPLNPTTPKQGASDPITDHAAGNAQQETPSESPTPEQMIARFNSEGITGVPKDVSDSIIRKINRSETPEEQLRFINEQSAAWRHINGFTETDNDMPDHMKRMLVEKLSTKHGDSWKDMATELDEQVAASAKVMELRLNGIPGMSIDESHDLIIQAIEKHGADYKAILSIANQSAGK